MALVAAYAFDETGSTTTLPDLSGNNRDGTLVNFSNPSASWVSSQSGYGNCLDFISADNNRVDIGNWNVTTGQITMMLWVNINSSQTHQDPRLLMKGTSTSEQDHTWFIGSYDAPPAWPDTWRVRLKINGTTVTVVAADNALPQNTWAHLAVTYDGNHIRLYTNSVLQADQGGITETAVSGSLTQTTDGISIGAVPGGGKTPNGFIDEVRIYDTALSQSEIQDAMNNPLQSSTGDIVDLVGQSLLFANNDVDISTSASVNLDSQSSSVVVSDLSVSSDANITLDGQSLSSNQNNLTIVSSAIVDLVGQSISSTINNIDIETSGSVTLDSQLLSSNQNNLIVNIGSSIILDGHLLDNNINDISIDTSNATVNLESQSISNIVGELDVIENTTPAPDSRTVNIAGDARIVFVEPALPGTFPPFSNSEVWVYGIPDLSLALGTLDASVVVDELVGHWRFNGDATDATVYGNNGTEYGGTISYVAGQDGNAISFSAASSQYVEVARDSVFETQAITVALWIRPDGAQPAYTGIVKKSINNNTGPIFGSWGLQFSGTAGTNLFFATGHSGGPDDLSFTSPINNNGATWTHIVLTYDPNTTIGSDNKIVYINGVIDNSKELHDAISYDTTSNDNLFIGQSGDSLSFYNGEIDDLRIYNYALDQTAVTSLYNSYSAGDATTDLVGQSASLSLNGLAVVGHATLTLDTQSLTAALGTLNAQGAASLTLSGLPIGAAVGNLDAVGSSDITLDTQALSAALNSLGVTGDVALLLGDHSLATTLGTVDVQAGAVTTTTLDSQVLTATLGNLNLTTSANFTLGTQATTVNLGSLTVSIPSLNVPAPDVRTITIAAQSRNITIAAFDRSTNISAQDKTVTITDQGRIINILLR